MNVEVDKGSMTMVFHSNATRIERQVCILYACRGGELELAYLELILVIGKMLVRNE